MATKKPRIQVTLDVETDAAVRRLALISNQSRSAVIGSLITQCREPLEQLSDILERANALSDTLPQATKDAVQTAADELDVLDAQARRLMESFANQLSLPCVQGSDENNPPPLTGGSTSQDIESKTGPKPLRHNKSEGGLN